MTPNTTKPKNPKPQPHPKKPSYHCGHCQRDGHLVEFCFRRKRVERAESARGGQEQFYQQGGRLRVPRCGERMEARSRRVGGGRGDDFHARAPNGGVRAGRTPGRFGYDGSTLV
ncbi:hypothetical protein GUJ93_ZPchr0006g43560 [Zizania palustris]|uniref:Uncharacterized protein n=1 Tax=Zizania palustris TaxID=103762 RepID=A0A8J5W246_ZIZPA|nr:hypothetical protein GUJ93_ZPchr0006g43560 [Zizania palustris]